MSRAVSKQLAAAGQLQPRSAMGRVVSVSCLAMQFAVWPAQRGVVSAAVETEQQRVWHASRQQGGRGRFPHDPNWSNPAAGAAQLAARVVVR